jgi:uncharacterized RmlC-like cupin family protein
MSIEKKSLISTLKSAKKANLANEISHDQSTRTTGVKAQPVIKLAAKQNLVTKAAIKSNLVSKAAVKMNLVTKAAKKTNLAMKAAAKR